MVAMSRCIKAAVVAFLVAIAVRIEEEDDKLVVEDDKLVVEEENRKEKHKGAETQVESLRRADTHSGSVIDEILSGRTFSGSTDFATGERVERRDRFGSDIGKTTKHILHQHRYEWGNYGFVLSTAPLKVSLYDSRYDRNGSSWDEVRKAGTKTIKILISAVENDQHKRRLEAKFRDQNIDADTGVDMSSLKVAWKFNGGCVGLWANVEHAFDGEELEEHCNGDFDKSGYHSLAELPKNHFPVDVTVTFVPTVKDEKWQRDFTLDKKDRAPKAGKTQRWCCPAKTLIVDLRLGGTHEAKREGRCADGSVCRWEWPSTDENTAKPRCISTQSYNQTACSYPIGADRSTEVMWAKVKKVKTLGKCFIKKGSRREKACGN